VYEWCYINKIALPCLAENVSFECPRLLLSKVWHNAEDEQLAGNEYKNIPASDFERGTAFNTKV